jgi:hypothetical protein
MSRDLNQKELVELEELIDRASLQAVLEAISTICGEKADHILGSYDDRATAKVWQTAERAIGVVSTHKAIAMVSR